MRAPIDLTYGPDKPARQMPSMTGPTLPGQDVNMVLLLAERWNRASSAMQKWSETAKKSVEYFEGKQWSETDLRKLEAEGRPALVINKIKPLVHLVLGYHLNNQTDIDAKPAHDGTGAESTASAITAVFKQVAQNNEEPYIDCEAFLDGISTGRGFIDQRLDFSENRLGEIRVAARDPFAVYLDPDGDQYDLNMSNYVMESRWVSIDEIDHFFGRDAATAVSPWISGGSFSGVPTGIFDVSEEMTPWRRFGGEENVEDSFWGGYFHAFYDWVDRARKSVRMIDVQHYVWVKRWVFIDLETGDMSIIPDHWTREKVEKTAWWAEQRGNPVVVAHERMRRLRNTQMIGDVIVYDRWSPYESMTLTPFFPYFRRGKTKGMVEDLLGPQDEINVMRSNRINIMGRASHGGWLWEKNTLDPQQEANLEMHGSAPGFKMKWDSKGGRLPEPKQIFPGVPPVAIQQLEDDADQNLNQIAGINPAALGEIEAANASGRAVEARQRQTIVGLELFIANHKRTQIMKGKKRLQLIQRHYTEPRIIRVMGDQGTTDMRVMINQRSAEGIVNDVTLGKYNVVVDTSTATATFLQAQFEELMRMKELGMPIPDDMLIDASSFGRKDEFKERMAMERQRIAEEQARAEMLQATSALTPPAAGGGGGRAPALPPRAGAGDAAGAPGTEVGAPMMPVPGP